MSAGGNRVSTGVVIDLSHKFYQYILTCFNLNLFVFVCVYVFLLVCMCTVCTQVPEEARRWRWNLCERS